MAASLFRILLFVACFATVMSIGPGLIYGYKEYTAYYPGSKDSPLVLTVPHGGKLALHTVHTRYRGCWDYRERKCNYTHECYLHERIQENRCLVSAPIENYTISLGKMIRAWIGMKTGVYPHLVMSTLQTAYLEPDENKVKGTFGEEEIIKAYEDYHNFIKDSVQANGLLVDIHGHTRQTEMVELGYLTWPSHLASSYISPSLTSMAAMLRNSSTTSSMKDLLVGLNSLGAYIEAGNYEALPSPHHPTVDANSRSYTKGGFTVAEYSRSQELSAVELAVPRSLRGGLNGAEFAVHVAESLVHFLSAHLPNCGHACHMDPNVEISVEDLFAKEGSDESRAGSVHTQHMLLWLALTVIALLIL